MRQTLARYGRWGPDPASPYHDGTLYRVARVEEGLVPFRLSVSGPVARPRATVSFAGPDTPAVRRALRQHAARLLGEAWDLPGFYTAVAADPVLAPFVRPAGALFGLRPTIVPDAFEMLVGSISAQQVNLAFAFATRARLVRRYGSPVEFEGTTVYAFPAPTALAAAPPSELRAMQFSERKAEYIVGLARHIVSGELDLDALRRLSNDEVIERLTAVRGFGRWSAEWFLARGLGRGDVCPAGDLGVRRAFEHFYGRGRLLSEEAIRRRSARWGDHQNLAVHYLLAGRRLATAAAAGGGA